VLQPGGVRRSLSLRRWWGGGVGCPAAAGGGHWLLVGSEPLPEVVVGRVDGDAGSACFQSDHLGKRVGQSEGPGVL
jgi:hypothetical protein